MLASTAQACSERRDTGLGSVTGRTTLVQSVHSLAVVKARGTFDSDIHCHFTLRSSSSALGTFDIEGSEMCGAD